MFEIKPLKKKFLILFILIIILILSSLNCNNSSNTKQKTNKKVEKAKKTVDSFLFGMKNFDKEKILYNSNSSYKSEIPKSDYDFQMNLLKYQSQVGLLEKWSIISIKINDQANQAIVKVNLKTSQSVQPLYFDLRYEDKRYKVASLKNRPAQFDKLRPDYSTKQKTFHK